MLRQTRLKVIDEVANGLSHLRLYFSFASCRASTARSRTSSKPSDGKRRKRPIPSFLRIGSWIGGDRDGNPFVTAEVLNEAVRQQSARALAYYLDEVHELGGDLSLAASTRLRQPGTGGARRAARRFRNRRRENPTVAPLPACIRALSKTALQLDHVDRAAPAGRRSQALLASAV